MRRARRHRRLRDSRGGRNRRATERVRALRSWLTRYQVLEVD